MADAEAAPKPEVVEPTNGNGDASEPAAKAEPAPAENTDDAAAAAAAAEKKAKKKAKKNAKKAKAAAAAADGEDEQPADGEDAEPAAATAEADDDKRGAKCKECNKAKHDLYRDKTDGKLYCGKCWKVFYGKNAPKSARFEQGAPKKPRDLPPEVIGEPIAGDSAVVDEFYEAPLRDDVPQVFVDRHKIAWSVMLKGVKDKLAYAVLQLILHQDACVVFERTGLITEGGERAKALYHEFTELPDAKEKFEQLFFDMTGNDFDKVRRCVTKFVTRKDFTLLADVKAARRAENELNRQAREDAQKKVVESRNAEIVAKVKAELVEGAAEAVDQTTAAAAAAPAVSAAVGKPQANGNGNASLGLSDGPAIRTEDKRKSPKPPPITNDSNLRSGELSPAEPPCTPAAAPAPKAAQPSPAQTAAPAPGPSTSPLAASKAPERPVPPPAPSSRPAQPPSSSLTSSRAAPKAESKPAAAAPAASTTAPAAAKPAPKKTFDVDESDSQGGNSMMLVAAAVGVVAVAGAAFFAMRKRQ